MRRIGVDFDNTIACYDTVFFKVAHDMGCLPGHSELTKTEVKKMLLDLDGGDLLWQKIQGQVYGKYMRQATIYPGFIEFLWLSKLRGDEVCVISHKSKYGHFDERKIKLREAAKTWIEENLVKATFSQAFSEVNQIHFESSRKEKVDRVSQIGCDIFIDDLREVFDEAHFPAKTEKILFSLEQPADSKIIYKQFDSWRKISGYLYNEAEAEEVKIIVQSNFESLNIEKIELKKGRGNSRIYQLSDPGNRKYALKIYPDIQSDNRPRLATEFHVCSVLSKAGLPVPFAVDRNEELNWGIYEWIHGMPIAAPGEDFLNQSFAFIKRLQADTQISSQPESFPLASEACLSCEEIIFQIKKRFNKLAKVNDDNLGNFLKQELLPILESAGMRAERQLGSSFAMPLAAKYRVLSPSDFGAHNAIVDTANKCCFYDFEYFGWDDPVKLTSDFFWHPGMDLSEDLKLKWLHLTRELFGRDPSYAKRLDACLPLFGLRWCLILLSEFIPERFLSRSHANKTEDVALKNILEGQLQKAKTLLKKIIEMVGHGSTIKVS
jgi:hypothetical protein